MRPALSRAARVAAVAAAAVLALAAACGSKKEPPPAGSAAPGGDGSASGAGAAGAGSAPATDAAGAGSAPATGAAGAAGTTAAGAPGTTAAGPAGALPAECADYRETITRLARCGDALPQTTRDNLQGRFDQQWAAWAKLPEQERRTLASICQRSAEAVKAAAAVACGW